MVNDNVKDRKTQETDCITLYHNQEARSGGNKLHSYAIYAINKKICSIAEKLEELTQLHASFHPCRKCYTRVCTESGVGPVE